MKTYAAVLFVIYSCLRTFPAQEADRSTVVMWDGTSELPDVSETSDSPGGSGEVEERVTFNTSALDTSTHAMASTDELRTFSETVDVSGEVPIEGGEFISGLDTGQTTTSLETHRSSDLSVASTDLVTSQRMSSTTPSRTFQSVDVVTLATDSRNRADTIDDKQSTFSSKQEIFTEGGDLTFTVGTSSTQLTPHTSVDTTLYFPGRRTKEDSSANTTPLFTHDRSRPLFVTSGTSSTDFPDVMSRMSSRPAGSTFETDYQGTFPDNSATGSSTDVTKRDSDTFNTTEQSTDEVNTTEQSPDAFASTEQSSDVLNITAQNTIAFNATEQSTDAFTTSSLPVTTSSTSTTQTMSSTVTTPIATSTSTTIGSTTPTATTSTTTTTTVATTTRPLQLGDKCRIDSDCNHIASAFCNGTCRCQRKSFQSEKSCVPDKIVIPKKIHFEQENSSYVRVHWTIQSSKYVLRIQVSWNSTSSPLVLGSNVTNTVLDLDPDTDYRVKVTAVTIPGREFSGTIDLTTVPGPVHNISSRVDASNITLTWTNASVTHSNITYIIEIGSKTFNTHDTRLLYPGKYDTCYKIQVTANNTAGSGPPSFIQVATTSGAPGFVRNLDASVVRPSGLSVLINWDRPNVTNGVVVGYSVVVHDIISNENWTLNISCADCPLPCKRKKRSPHLSPFLTLTTFPASSTTHRANVSNLSPFTGYNIFVMAYTRQKFGPVAQVTISTPEASPVQPSNVTVSANDTSLTVFWVIQGRRHGDTRYNVITYDSKSDREINTTCETATAPTFMCEVKNLTPFWTYTVWVQALNSAGTTHSAPFNVTTQDAVPGPVTNLRIQGPDDVIQPRTLAISWKQPALRNRHGEILFYNLAVTCREKTILLNTTLLQVNDSVRAECLYNVKVKAATRKGSGVEISGQYRVPAGAPRQTHIRPIKSTNSIVGDPTQQIAILVPPDFLCDVTFGRVMYWGVATFPEGHLSPDRRIYRGPRSSFADHYLPGQIAINRSLPQGSCHTPTDVIIGDGTRANNVHNQPLEPGTSYSFLVFACTTEGCTESLYSSYITTEEIDSNAVVVGVVSGVGLFLLSCVLGVVLFKLWRKRASMRPHVHFDPAIIELGPKKASIVSESQKCRPVKLQNFAEHVDHLHRDSNLGFSEEYKLVKQLSPKHFSKAAEQQACRTKNRYTNVLPFDHARVKLLSQDDEEGSDYINANFINGYNCKREYMAAQGPLPCTKDDFWRMLWEQRVTVIVMLTQCKERGRIKCEKYWPDNTDPVYFGDLIVQLRSESVLQDYVIRILDVKQGNKKRMIRHLHFLKWPDFGCPEKTWHLLNFVSAVRSHTPHVQDGPTVVHCSAGVGRTGTFIAVDCLLQQIKLQNELDIFSLVLEMRENRPLMVQTENQYIYIHDCIRDALQETDDEGSLGDEEEEEEEDPEPIYENV